MSNYEQQLVTVSYLSPSLDTSGQRGTVQARLGLHPDSKGGGRQAHHRRGATLERLGSEGVLHCADRLRSQVRSAHLAGGDLRSGAICHRL